MRYTVTKQVIQVIGYIWQPGVGICAQQYTLDAHDLATIEDIHDRNDVEGWLKTHAGDFSHIVDFRADFHLGDEHLVHDWAGGETSEIAYDDCTD